MQKAFFSVVYSEYLQVFPKFCSLFFWDFSEHFQSQELQNKSGIFIILQTEAGEEGSHRQLPLRQLLITLASSSDKRKISAGQG